MAKAELVRVILDTGRDEGSRILALVDSEYAEYLAWYYGSDQFRTTVKELGDKAYDKMAEAKLKADTEVESYEAEFTRHTAFYSALLSGRILILDRTFGRGK